MSDVNAVYYNWIHIVLTRLHCGWSALFKLPCSWIWCFASQRGVHAHLVDHESKFPGVPPELSQRLTVFFCVKGKLLVIYSKTCFLENVVSLNEGKPQINCKKKGKVEPVTND